VTHSWRQHEDLMTTLSPFLHIAKVNLTPAALAHQALASRRPWPFFIRMDPYAPAS
jgi:hypothetical protein